MLHADQSHNATTLTACCAMHDCSLLFMTVTPHKAAQQKTTDQQRRGAMQNCSLLFMTVTVHKTAQPKVMTVTVYKTAQPKLTDQQRRGRLPTPWYTAWSRSTVQ